MPTNALRKIDYSQSTKEKNSKSKTKTIITISEVGFVLLILVLWFSFETIRVSKNLWVLFLYTFPSQFLIAIVPHEPVFFFFSKFYTPLTVTLVAIAGTLITEYINYSVFQYVSDFKVIKKILSNKLVQKLVDLFKKAPFLALFIAGFSPVPFYPFRIIAVIAEYPIIKYLLAVFLSRSPRFYIFALFAHALKISDTLLLAFFIILIIVANIQFLINIGKFRRKKKYPLNHTAPH